MSSGWKKELLFIGLSVCLFVRCVGLVGSLKNVFRLAGLAERLQEEVSELMPSTSHVQVITSLPGYE